MRLPKSPERRRLSSLQFGLRPMLGLVTSCCLLFAVLAALGLRGMDVLIALGAGVASAGAAVLVVETVVTLAEWLER